MVSFAPAVCRTEAQRVAADLMLAGEATAGGFHDKHAPGRGRYAIA